MLKTHLTYQGMLCVKTFIHNHTVYCHIFKNKLLVMLKMQRKSN